MPNEVAVRLPKEAMRLPEDVKVLLKRCYLIAWSSPRIDIVWGAVRLSEEAMRLLHEHETVSSHEVTMGVSEEAVRWPEKGHYITERGHVIAWIDGYNYDTLSGQQQNKLLCP